ncbi:MAG: endonuclease MutS2 [Clostridiales bacterium]|jgi:DNA mismatch repair protein MutS2|nr:endonuclease MutS2 [Clostridiales bacterium]
MKSVKVLEFDKITAKLADKAISVMGKGLAGAIAPMDDIFDINRAQDETAEAVSLILRKGSLPLGGCADITESLKRAKAGGVLSMPELMRAADFCYVCKKIGNYHNEKFGSSDASTYPILDAMFDMITVPAGLEKELNRCIVNENEMADDASAALALVRKNIGVANNRVREALNSIIHSGAYKNMLQDAVVTIRNDRYCVPIKQEYRASFSGMVHDQSSSGSTVFIEPMSVVTLNNKIKELRASERDEIDKILRTLTDMVADEAEPLLDNIKMLASLDFAFAKGELALSMKAVRPVYNPNGRINIKKARHPLLNPDTVVAMDAWLGDAFRILVITGPNTGGKTVALKTIGLLCLMGQAGLHIPAADNSELSVFEVYADIGDEQSIEQSLSTFSSHMKNIVSILSVAHQGSLVLLDELGAGTDPTEGAALASAILDYLHEKKIRAVVTTHYSELKVYALSKDGVENASCEFDVATLRPTYRLLIGIPGKSNAFAISQKLGLSDKIITAARQIVSQENARFEDVIADLEISRKAAEAEQARAEGFRHEAERLKKEFETRKQKLEESSEKILALAKDEARRLTLEAKNEADRLLKEYQKSLRDNQLKEAEASRKQLRDKAVAMDDTEEERDLRPLPKQLKNGDRVYIHTLNQSGSVISGPDASGDVMVMAGAMRVKVNIKNLSLDETREKNRPTPTTFARSAKASAQQSITPSCDLRGLTMDEGVDKADKYLDAAFLSSLPQVTLIHGKGTGVLRAAIQSMVKKHPHVKSYRLGQYGEGGDGVTLVELE